MVLKFDDVLKHLGEFGPYQKKLSFLICCLGLPPALHAFAQVFLAAETDHWCRAPELDAFGDNWNCTLRGSSHDACLETIKNFSIPFEDGSSSCDAKLVYSNCYRYDIRDVEIHPGNDVTMYTNATMKCDHGWNYDRSQYKSSLFQEFDLVCDRYYLGALASSIFMAGKFFGAIIIGAFSDRFGRLPTLTIASLCLAACGTACAFSPNIVVYSVFRFGLGLTTTGTFLVAFVFATELVGPSKRIFVGLVIEFFFSFGYMLLAGVAYFVRYWWILQLAISLPSFLFLIYWWIIPESPRWLLSTGQTERAEKVIREFEKGNGVHVPEKIYKELTQNQERVEEVQEKKGSVLDIMKYPSMRKRSFNLFFNWATHSLVYYGLSLNTSNLGGSDYLNAFISGAVEIPAYIMSLYIPNTILGRRWSMCGTMVIAGLACTLTLFVPPCDIEWLRITLAMIGKFCISASFAIVYVFSAEMYPTPIRTVGMGLCSMCARVGGILAPQILLIGKLWTPLPVVVFGATSITAGLLVLLLPETRNKDLPETIEEGERLGQETMLENRKDGEEKKTGDVGEDSGKEKHLAAQNDSEEMRNGIENPAIDMSGDNYVNVGTQTTEM